MGSQLASSIYSCVNVPPPLLLLLIIPTCLLAPSHFPCHPSVRLFSSSSLPPFNFFLFSLSLSFLFLGNPNLDQACLNLCILSVQKHLSFTPYCMWFIVCTRLHIRFSIFCHASCGWIAFCRSGTPTSLRMIALISTPSCVLVILYLCVAPHTLDFFPCRCFLGVC